LATFASLLLLVGLVLGVVVYARRPRPIPPRREAVPTLIPADSTDFLPSTIAAPIRSQEARTRAGDSRRFEDSQ
jgi:hypothetical protein